MNRNVESRFALNPTKLDIGRSRFDMPSSVKFTFNVGELVPFFVQEVLPADTFQIKTNKVVRLQTPLTPFMDNLYLDTYYFFVPNRLVWSHWKEFMGENTSGPWLPAASYSVPQIKTDNTHRVGVGSAHDYMGIPTGIDGLSFMALPIRAYGLIWNEWFRDENLQYPVNVPLTDNDFTLSATTDQTSNVNDGSTAVNVQNGRPLAVNKYHDYFTSALKAPQRGPDVTISMIPAPVPVSASGPLEVVDANDHSGVLTYNALSTPSYVDVYPSTDISGQLSYSDGLEVDMTGVSVATINQLRTAFQLQKLYEKDAMGGSRYTEILRSHFSVVSPDARLQRPEYLGGNRLPINVNQVVQSSQSDTTPQGHTAAYSLTVDSHGDFIQSFTEHGFVIGVCCARYDHSYQQGLEKFWSRKTRMDYYWPVFANLGNQPILNKEIYAQGAGVVDSDGVPYDEQVFGYQEYAADYRYKPSRIAGEMRSAASTPLDSWHLADNYNQLPSLSAGWIREDLNNVDRVLAIKSSTANQLFADFYIQTRATRAMPMYSIPGLIDHH